MRINLLFCSIAFPPKNDPESLQTGKYFKGLSKFKNLAIQVVTSSNPTLFMPVDKSINLTFRTQDSLIEIPIFENKYTNFLFRKLKLPFIEQPDSKFTFHWQSKTAQKNIKTPDILYSRSFPLSSTLMAFRLKKTFNCPWILHISDPWSWSPIHNHKGKEAQWNNEWEQKCFAAADIISLTSIPTIDKYKSLYPQYAEKFKFYPNLLDEEKINSKPYQLKDKLHFVYTGGLAGGRSPAPFLEALTTLLKNNPTYTDLIKVTFAGPIDRKNKELFTQHQLSCLTHVGQLTFDDAQQLQLEADVLIVIDNEISNPDEAVFFPSKLLDYFATKRRVFAITTPNSCTHSVLEEHNADITFRNDTASIYNALSQNIEAFVKGDTQHFINSRSIEKYTIAENTERLHKEILQLTSPKLA